MPAKRRTLLLLIAGMLVIWLIVLPTLGRVPAVRRHIDRNRERQVQADAMFYTEVGPVEGVTIEHRRDGIAIGKIRMAPAEPEWMISDAD